MLKITQESIQEFENHLYLEEKSNATIRKYSKAVSKLHEYLTKRDLELTKGAILEYRDNLKKYLKVQTINGILSAINSYLNYQGQQEYKVKLLKIQQQVFRDESKELTETEYRRLLMTAKNRGDERLYMVMLTIGNTGIRISELKYITLEAVKRGRAEVDLKAKQDELEEETRKKAVVQLAIGTLSYSELEAVEHIFNELDGNEGLLVASKIADKVGITRSVIVNALRKFESAGVIESRSLGMKGTHIKILNDKLLDELKKIR